MAPVHYQILQDMLRDKSLAQGSYDEFMERAKASYEAKSGPGHHQDKSEEGGENL